MLDVSLGNAIGRLISAAGTVSAYLYNPALNLSKNSFDFSNCSASESNGVIFNLRLIVSSVAADILFASAIISWTPLLIDVLSSTNGLNPTPAVTVCDIPCCNLDLASVRPFNADSWFFNSLFTVVIWPCNSRYLFVSTSVCPLISNLGVLANSDLRLTSCFCKDATLFSTFADSTSASLSLLIKPCCAAWFWILYYTHLVLI